jgi:hypothetical protein
MKTWIREETRRGLHDAEEWRRGEVRLRFQVLAVSRGAAPATGGAALYVVIQMTREVSWDIESDLTAIMHDVAHFSGLLSERVLSVRPAGSV